MVVRLRACVRMGFTHITGRPVGVFGIFLFFSGSLAVIFLLFWGGVLYEAFLLYFVTLFISSFFSPFLILDGSRMEGLGMAIE